MSEYRKNALTYTVLAMAALVTLGAWFIDDKSVFNMAMGSWLTALGAFMNYYFGSSHKQRNDDASNT